MHTDSVGSVRGPGTGDRAERGQVAGTGREMMAARASRCRQLGATGMNNLPVLRTHLNSGPERA
jgi:hypothetical protein